MPPLPNHLVEHWRPSHEAASWAKRNRFGSPIPMTDGRLRALARDHESAPTGLYLWEGVRHEIYVGISERSVVTRLRAHVKNYSDANIQTFWYRPHPADRTELRDIERELIHDAIRDGFVVYNCEHSSSIYGDSPFDDLVPVDDQVAWCADPTKVNLASAHTLQPISPSENVRSAPRFTRLLARDDADEIIDAVALYLRACTPLPFLTPREYWGVSCLPNTRLDNGYARVVTLNMGMLEMLWINDGPEGMSVSVGTDYQFLPARFTAHKLKKVGARMRGIVHRSGGANEEVLTFGSVRAFIDAIDRSPDIVSAAGRFALDRMRKGRLSGRYRDAHKALLAEAALTRIGGRSVDRAAQDAR
ncbi:GIY-YIG nuclease family protein [Gordonia sp. VNK1]|uniref:GIY-YIG nuclease family protein n=1 Tax=Gordonia oleivorans TaxID=3156618 RepID=UPI0032B45EB8